MRTGFALWLCALSLAGCGVTTSPPIERNADPQLDTAAATDTDGRALVPSAEAGGRRGSEPGASSAPGASELAAPAHDADGRPGEPSAAAEPAGIEPRAAAGAQPAVEPAASAAEPEQPGAQEAGPAAGTAVIATPEPAGLDRDDPSAPALALNAAQSQRIGLQSRVALALSADEIAFSLDASDLPPALDVRGYLVHIDGPNGFVRELRASTSSEALRLPIAQGDQPALADGSYRYRVDPVRGELSGAASASTLAPLHGSLAQVMAQRAAAFPSAQSAAASDDTGRDPNDSRVQQVQAAQPIYSASGVFGVQGGSFVLPTDEAP